MSEFIASLAATFAQMIVLVICYYFINWVTSGWLQNLLFEDRQQTALLIVCAYIGATFAK